MNQIQWPPTWERPCTCHQHPCVCGCEGDFRCTPEWMEDLTKCWREIAKFKKMLEQMIIELNMHGSAGPQGPAGPAGAQGPQGAAGPAGLDLAYVSATAPPSPQNGELWLNTTNNTLNVYEASNTTWIDVTGVIPVPGPAGPMGPQGAAGPQGPVGSQGPQGPQGAVGAQGPQGAQGPAGVFNSGGPGTVFASVDNGNPPGVLGMPGSWSPVAAFSAQANDTGAMTSLYLWQRIA